MKEAKREINPSAFSSSSGRSILLIADLNRHGHNCDIRTARAFAPLFRRIRASHLAAQKESKMYGTKGVACSANCGFDFYAIEFAFSQPLSVDHSGGDHDGLRCFNLLHAAGQTKVALGQDIVEDSIGKCF